MQSDFTGQITTSEIRDLGRESSALKGRVANLTLGKRMRKKSMTADREHST